MSLPDISDVRVDVIAADGTVKESRLLRLEPGKPFKVQRASSDVSKSLVPRENNATFDCKVVSRDHAIFEITSDLPGPLFIIDTSKYGTFVNDKRLVKGLPTKISSGDNVKFGNLIIHAPDSVPHDAVEARVYFHENDSSPALLTPPTGSASAPIDLSEGLVDSLTSASPRSHSPCPLPRKGQNTFTCPSTSSGDGEYDVDSEDDETDLVHGHIHAPKGFTGPVIPSNLSGFTDSSLDEQLDGLFSSPSPRPSFRDDGNPIHVPSPLEFSLNRDKWKKFSTYSELLAHFPLPAANSARPGSDIPIDPPTYEDPSFLRTPVGTYEEFVALRKDSRNFMCQDECSCCDYGDDDPQASQSHPNGKESQAQTLSAFGTDLLHHNDHRDLDSPRLDITALSPELLTSEDDKFDGPITPTHPGPVPAVSVVDRLQTTRSKLHSDIDRSMAYFKLPMMKFPAEDNVAFKFNQEASPSKKHFKSLPDSRLSIGNLVNAIPEASKSDNGSGQKRKASELEEDTDEQLAVPLPVVGLGLDIGGSELSQPQATASGHQSAAIPSDQSSHTESTSITATPRSTKRFKSALNAAFTATAYAALGSIATIGFLASPFAERLASM